MSGAGICYCKRYVRRQSLLHLLETAGSKIAMQCDSDMIRDRETGGMSAVAGDKPVRLPMRPHGATSAAPPSGSV